MEVMRTQYCTLLLRLHHVLPETPVFSIVLTLNGTCRRLHRMIAREDTYLCRQAGRSGERKEHGTLETTKEAASLIGFIRTRTLWCIFIAR